ncbi:glycoside hydrolase family 30 protein [Haliscomenobacter hydrossis]|uniref:Glucosylceramidase n=1 Tax=Haliscomenobacter hydrossis (strain ATCC 27775 / DSM 1100 / LMG 10767 / O) TaxID=760192 RepID=F4KRM3_HALH1|nr:glycoside hydrolase family 30 protein [Haliscomenobacter hydrossis]AEE49012.1 Glucosylceramidase [Haliscomenobacter hydrossis DSM 1100]
MKLNVLTFFLLLFTACTPKTSSIDSEKTGNIDRKTVAIFTTADSTKLRLSPGEALIFSPFGQPFENQPCVFVDPAHQFQTFVGIGAALTDAAAETFAKLPPAKQTELLQAYFDPQKGIGYTLARTNINSCDFSSDMYTYVDDNDRELKSFTLAHDERYKVPFIKKATAAAGGNLPLLVSPWSPPAWMKDNQNMLQGGKLKPEFFDSWANYYVKFIQGYEKMGIPIWGLSVQNEPMAKQTWESCIFTAQEETDFIKNHLGPTLKKNGLADKKLIAWDHNRDLIYQRASTYLSDPGAAKYIWGIGFHWYEIWNGGRQYENVKRVAEAFPDKNLLLTEACNYPFSWQTFDQWSWGEQYGENMIHDFNNGAVAWIDWNILLDETGGPNHVKNFCFAPVHAKTQAGSLHYMNSYYYIGHFSKFIRPGAKRIISSSSRAQLLTTAFLNPDGSIVLIVMNQRKEKISYHLCLGGQAVETVSLPHSIVTMVF